MSENIANDVLLELKKSFLDDKKVLQDRNIEIEAEIKETKEFIDSLNKKDDCDYNLFSPRSASRVYKDQVSIKTQRIEELEEELRDNYKKLSTIFKKVDSLNSLNLDSVELPNVKKTSEDKTAYLQLQEDDRHRIAADLHDSVLQNLTLVMHNLELASKFIDYDSVRAKLELESDRKIIKDTIDEIRSTIFDLRPMQFDDFGFKKSLEQQLDSYKSRTTMNIDYFIDDIDSLNHLILLSIFRIVQELINNSIKHSKATEVSVKVLKQVSNIHIEVIDNGIGIDSDSLNKDNHFGLKILRERVSMVNGTLFYPDVEKGFKAVIEIPF